MSEGTNPHVAILGLGRMGTSIATAFLTAGYTMTVWNRDTAEADLIVAHGAGRAHTAADAVRAGA